MGIKQTLDVINAMERDGVIERYAIGGAVAAYNSIEPTVTDIFVSFKSSGRRPLFVQDLTRVAQFLQEEAVNLKRLKRFLEQHMLLTAWRSFCAKRGTRDPLVAK